VSHSDMYWRKPKPPHSRIKSEVVAYYFSMWAAVVGRSNARIGYLDLYAGRGETFGGEPSTAIRVLSAASAEPTIASKLVAILNDRDSDHCLNLRQVIEKRGFLQRLRYKPIVLNRSVNQVLAEELDALRLIPSLCFIDPYGYKGVSIDLIKAVIKDWGCDVILFFYTCGINRNIGLEDSEEYLAALFGRDVYENLKAVFKTGVCDREKTLLDAFCRKLSDEGIKHCLPFRFNFRNSKRLSHHLLFLSKSDAGFNLVKKAVAKYSQTEEGIPTWTYTDGRENVAEQLSILSDGPMNKLCVLLELTFGGVELTVSQLIKSCDDKGFRYTDRNIKDALLRLEDSGKVVVDKPAERRRRAGKVTIGDKRVVRFLG